MLIVWNAFDNHENYRIACKQDFNIPDWTKEIARTVDIERCVKEPWDRSFLKNTDEFTEYVALIVVDINKSDKAKFGLVIFNLVKSGKCEIHWLCKNVDLSKAILSHNGAGPYLQEFCEDKSIKGQLIRWNQKKHVYYGEGTFDTKCKERKPRKLMLSQRSTFSQHVER
jgi:hypothetical protein